jgi:crotonobetaine/carnitine-CoA ligase
MDAAVHSVVGDRSVSSVLREGARLHPDRCLLIYDDLESEPRAFSWSEVLRCSEAAAQVLLDHGVRPGDAIHLHLSNCPEFLFAWFAAAHLGARIVPTNTAAAVPELAFIVGHAKTRLSVTHDEYMESVGRANGKAAPDASLLCAGELCRAAGAPLTLPDPGPGTDLGVIYTSGTTSRPKGVRVTHANYIYAGETTAAALQLTPQDRFLTVLPLFHANAQYYSTMGTLVAGGTIVLARRFSASRYADLAIRHSATVGSLFAAPIRMILGQEPAARWKDNQLRVVIFAQDLTDREHTEWVHRMNAPLLQLYGMTETIGPPVMNSLLWPRRHDAIGRPALGYHVRIRRDDGSPAAIGEPGELLVGGVPGVSLMAGYLDDPDATAAVLEDGWLATGDIVRRDSDGLLRFVGRSRDIIKRAGENVAAGEVEAVLLDHPDVADAAVVGVPDPIRDEQIVAFVVHRDGRNPSHDALHEWCAARLASFRVPSHFRAVAELPRTSVGKIQKHRLQEKWPMAAGDGEPTRPVDSVVP